MSVFDPNDDFEEWLHNDWESDDYIESKCQKRMRCDEIEESECCDSTSTKTPAIVRIFMFIDMLYNRIPYASIIICVLTFLIIYIVANKILDAHYATKYPQYSYLW